MIPINVLIKALGVKVGKSIPIMVSHHLTYRCPFNCEFCYRKEIPSEEMSTIQIKELMKKFSELGTVYWSLNGGEPLIREDIIEIAKFGKNCGFKINLTTSAIDKKKIILLSEILDFSEISLSSTEAIHTKLKGDGSYKKTLESAKLLKEKGVKVAFMTVLTKENIKHLSTLFDKVRELEIGVNFQPLAKYQKHLSNFPADYEPTKEEFVEGIDLIISEKKRNSFIFTSIEYLEMIKKFWPDKKLPMKCWAGKISCNITPDGKIFPCCNYIVSGVNAYLTLNECFKKDFSCLSESLNFCKGCYFNTNVEVNIIMNSVLKSSFRVGKNLIMGKWIWN